MSQPRYLVTGGCGFIGSHLVDRLLQTGAAVRVLDDLSTGRRSNVCGPAEVVIGDVRHRATLHRALQDVDGCFHLAAVSAVERCRRDWPGSHAVNVASTVGLFDLVKPASLNIPTVYASSAAVYGETDTEPLTEDQPVAPISAYGADKLACELHARAGAATHGLRTAGLRFFNVYGPRQDPASPYSGVISVFTDRLAHNRAVTIHGDGAQSRDFVAVSDAIEMCLRAMAHLQLGDLGTADVFNVCTGQATTVVEVARELARLFGRAPTIHHIPARDGDIRHSRGDPSRGATVLGHTPTTTLPEGLARVRDAAALAAA
jgi:UDP-glucose 4-epimerase